MDYILNAIVGILTPVISALGAWWIARQRSGKALTACIAAKEACNEEVHLLKDKMGTMELILIADKARILALERYVREKENGNKQSQEAPS